MEQEFYGKLNSQKHLNDMASKALAMVRILSGGAFKAQAQELQVRFDCLIICFVFF